MRTTIKRFTFGPHPERAFDTDGLLFGFDPEGLDGSAYETARARALYQALGLGDPLDEGTHVLGEFPDGRWAVVGRTVEEDDFAVEMTDKEQR